MRKTEKRMKGRVGILAAALLISGGLNASTPVWTYSAPTPARVEVSDGGTASVQYTITNQSSKSKNLVLKFTPGLSASACYLAGKGSSCLLTLTINGSEIGQSGLHTGPVLCEQSNLNQCYQPSAGHVLNISKVEAPSEVSVPISLSPETLTLAVGNLGVVTVRNDSSSTAVNYLQVNNLPVGIKIDAASTCVIGGSLPAGGHCSLVFRANAATASTAVIVKGNNTNEALLTLSATTTTISVSPQTSPPLILNADGVDEAVFIVTNTGTGVAAHIGATAVATPAWARVVLVPSLGCADLAPDSNDCTITVSSSTANVAGYLTVQGTNTNPVNTDYIAFRAGGGLVFSREENTPNPGDTTIKVVSESDDSTFIRWDSSTQCAGVNCTPIPAARNLNNGQANTEAIVLALTGQPGVTSTNYAAGLCSEKDVDGYNDWYLPAICELGASSGSPVGGGSCSIASIYTNLYAHDFPVFASPGSTFYWSSTEYPFNPVYAQSLWFPAGSVVGQFEDDRKLNEARVRCMRAFIS